MSTQNRSSVWLRNVVAFLSAGTFSVVAPALVWGLFPAAAQVPLAGVGASAPDPAGDPPATALGGTPAGTAFTYQGILNLNGAAVNGNTDFQFTLWDAASGGSQMGSFNDISTVVDGVWAVPLDFGTTPFATSEARWLEIAVRYPAGSGSYTTLTPRQEIRPTPHSLSTRGINVDGDGDVGLYGDIVVPGLVSAHGYASNSPIEIYTSDPVTGVLSLRAFVDDSTGHFGIGIPVPTPPPATGPPPLARLHVADMIIAPPIGPISEEDVIVEDDVALLGLYANSVAGPIGSGITLGEGFPNDRWSLFREPTAMGDLYVTKGPAVLPSANMPMLQITDTGDTYLVPFLGNVGLHEVAPAVELHVTGTATVADAALLTAGQEDQVIEDDAAYIGLFSSDELLGAGITMSQVPGMYPAVPADKWLINRHFTGAQSTLDFRWDPDPLVAGQSMRMSIAATGHTFLTPVVGNVTVGPLPGPALAPLHTYWQTADANAPTAIFEKNRAGAHYAVEIGGQRIDAVDMSGGVDPVPALLLNNSSPGDVIVANGGGNVILAAGIVPGSNVGIGDTSPDARLDVQQSGATVAIFNRLNLDGAIVEFQQAGITEGTISVSGTTVTYGTFTGTHYGWTNEPIARGTLVVMTGDNRRRIEDPGAEPRYGILPSHAPNDPRCLGAYLGLLEPTKPITMDNPHQIMAVGNGDMWVVDTGRPIKPGDYLISSDVVGHAMLDDERRFEVGYVIARAAEPVDWSTVADEIDSQKHQRISVFFESFTRGSMHLSELVVSQAQHIVELERQHSSHKLEITELQDRLKSVEELLRGLSSGRPVQGGVQ